MTLLNKIKNDIEKDYWIKIICEKLDISETVLREYLNSKKKVNYQVKQERNIAMKNLNNQESRLEKISKSILSLVLKFPEFIDYTISNLDKDQIINEKKSQFYNQLIIYYNEYKSLNFQEFNNWLKTNNEEMHSLLPELVLLGENDFSHLSQAEAQKELVHLISLNKDLFK